jgi:hypothetical protein
MINRYKINFSSNNKSSNIDTKIPEIQKNKNYSASTNRYSTIRSIIFDDLKQDYYRVKYQREQREQKKMQKLLDSTNYSFDYRSNEHILGKCILLIVRSSC